MPNPLELFKVPAWFRWNIFGPSSSWEATFLATWQQHPGSPSGSVSLRPALLQTSRSCLLSINQVKIRWVVKGGKGLKDREEGKWMQPWLEASPTD